MSRRSCRPASPRSRCHIVGTSYTYTRTRSVRELTPRQTRTPHKRSLTLDIQVYQQHILTQTQTRSSYEQLHNLRTRFDLENRVTAKSRISCPAKSRISRYSKTSNLRSSEISNFAPQRNLEFRAPSGTSNSALQRNLEFRAIAKSRISYSSEISNFAPQRNLEFRAPAKSRIPRHSEISNFALQRNLEFRVPVKSRTSRFSGI